MLKGWSEVFNNIDELPYEMAELGVRAKHNTLCSQINLIENTECQ